jgi:hypothetical protein
LFQRAGAEPCVPVLVLLFIGLKWPAGHGHQDGEADVQKARTVRIEAAGLTQPATRANVLLWNISMRGRG